MRNRASMRIRLDSRIRRRNALELIYIEHSIPSKSLLSLSFPKEIENTRIGREIIKVFRGYFYNKLGHLSRKYYNFILPKYAVKVRLLSLDGRGKGKYMYILTEDVKPYFLQEVEKLRMEYEKLQNQLTRFVTALAKGEIPVDVIEEIREEHGERVEFDFEYMEKVMEYLNKQYNVTWNEILKKINSINLPRQFKVWLFKLQLELDTEDNKELAEKILDEVENKFREVLNRILDSLMKLYEEKGGTLRQIRINQELKKLKKNMALYSSLIDRFEEIDIIEEMLDKPVEQWGEYLEKLGKVKIDEAERLGIR